MPGFRPCWGLWVPAIGHEVIVDGYGYNVSTLYHHLNLGWAGTADAWYNLPTISTGIYNFNSVIECIYNVFPQGSGEIISGRVLDAAGQPVSGADDNRHRRLAETIAPSATARGYMPWRKFLRLPPTPLPPLSRAMIFSHKPSAPELPSMATPAPVIFGGLISSTTHREFP